MSIGRGWIRGISLLAGLALAAGGPAAGLAETAAPAETALPAETAAQAETALPAETAAPAETPAGAAETVPALELPALTKGRIVDIAVERNDLTDSIPPKDDAYLYAGGAENPTGYADPSITVNFGRGRMFDTDYLYARVRIASPTQLRTLLASPPMHTGATFGHDLAKRVQSVIAINGDWCGGDDYNRGILMRQGELLRRKADGRMDVLVIDRAGDLHILEEAQDEDVEPYLADAVNIFTFGPALVVDGKPKYGVRLGKIGSGKPAQRMALCQTGPLEYLLLTCEGPENAGSVGMTIDQFAELTASFPEVRTAYNLDGGSSATMVFRYDGKNWQKVNALSSGKRRPLKDIVYFVSAWEPEE